MKPSKICAACKADNLEHTEIECLNNQIANLKAEVTKWKDSWFDQRRATGEIAWQWGQPHMRVHLTRHLEEKK